MNLLDAVEEALDDLAFGLVRFAEGPDFQATRRRAARRKSQPRGAGAAAGNRCRSSRGAAGMPVRRLRRPKAPAGRSFSRRRPATSGMVSMSKTRTGVMPGQTPGITLHVFVDPA